MVGPNHFAFARRYRLYDEYLDHASASRVSLYDDTVRLGDHTSHKPQALFVRDLGSQFSFTGLLGYGETPRLLHLAPRT